MIDNFFAVLAVFSSGWLGTCSVIDKQRLASIKEIIEIGKKKNDMIESINAKSALVLEKLVVLFIVF